MNFLPFENIEIESSKTPEEILQNIEGYIEPNIKLGLTFKKWSSKDYEGHVDYQESIFRFRRILKHGMNSFIPIIIGTIVDTGKTSFIKVKIRLHKFVYVFGIIMVLFIGVLIITPYFSSSKVDEMMTEFYQNEDIQKFYGEERMAELTKEDSKMNWPVIFMLIASYSMIIIFYNHEAGMVKSDLDRILGIKDLGNE